MKRILIAGAAAALALNGAAVSAGDINVGSAAAVTGPIAELVVDIVDARNLAASHVNAQGGLLGGDTLRLVQGDSQCDPKAAVDAGAKLVNVEQAVMVIGPNCSGATNGMAQSVTIPAGVVMISDTATAPSISDLDDGDLVFRVAPSDAYQGRSLAEHAWAQGYRKLAVTYANDDYNSGLAGVFAAAFTELGGAITGNEAHEPSKASYRAELATLAAGEAEGLALFAYFGSSGITILRNSLENALFGKFLGADGMMDNSVIEQIGADNLRGNILLSQPASDTEGESYKAFAAAFDSPGRPLRRPRLRHRLPRRARDREGGIGRSRHDLGGAARRGQRAGHCHSPRRVGQGQGSHRGRRGHQLRGCLRRHRVRRERRRGRHLLPQRRGGRRHLDSGGVGATGRARPPAGRRMR